MALIGSAARGQASTLRRMGRRCAIMTAPIRCAIYGTGHGHDVGKLRVLQESPDWEFAGACEPDPERQARCAHDPTWAGVRWLDERELLDDPTVQMVAVESDVPRLLTLATEAMAAGK